MDKTERRKQAMKKARRNKCIIAALCGIALVAVIILFSVNQFQRRGLRVFESGNNSITLTRDGEFRASLPHGAQRNGTFTETSLEDGTVIVAFTESGQPTVNGIITDDILTKPAEWDDGHGHPRNYRLR